LVAPLSLLLLVGPLFLVSVDAADILLEDSNLEVEIVAEGLKFPTGMAFLNSNEILVLEKDEGKVLRVIHGNISDNSVLNLDVSNAGERGLLGIALPRDLEGEDGKEKNAPKYVFLFYTEARYSGNGNADGNGNCMQQECEENQFNNRLYRYEFKDNKLVNPKLLIDIPLFHGESWANDSIVEAIHNGGALATDFENNIYLTTGDGGACLSSEACYRIIENGTLGAQTANKKGGGKPIGMGGILRVTDDGEPVDNKGILGDEHPLNLYYAYGIRNSFGIDFDPVTGKLWDTENGPDFGDEINPVEPGFNSGWDKIQGIWPISNYTQLYPTATQKGYFYSPIVQFDNDLEDFDGKGKYSDPEFTWNSSIGVTSIKFLDTDRLGKQYENDIFVADFYGRIYHFDLNENRTELDLNGPLSDKVANSDLELQDLIFAQGFDTITDMEVGPDGYLYVLSFSEGKIFRIKPTE
jgi:aldose sugar dehydrogenase